MHVVRHLRRGPQRELAFAVHCRHRRVLLDRQVRVAFVEEEILEYMIGTLQGSFSVAEFEGLQTMNVAELAIGVNAGLWIVERLLRCTDGAKNLIGDFD